MKFKILLLTTALISLVSCSSKKIKQTTSKRFRESETTIVYTTEFVLKQKIDIVEVEHDKKNDSWMFLNKGYYDSAIGFTVTCT
jgi:hypothetical protein